jgi:Asp-tRNA(Asn)/Glu-tRNA(Gln) amidotransferase A subunit family amidase
VVTLQAFKSGNLTCTELVNIYKDRIQSYDKVTGLNAIQRFNPNVSEHCGVTV